MGMHPGLLSQKQAWGENLSLKLQFFASSQCRANHCVLALFTDTGHSFIAACLLVMACWWWDLCPERLPWLLPAHPRHCGDNGCVRTPCSTPSALILNVSYSHLQIASSNSRQIGFFVWGGELFLSTNEVKHSVLYNLSFLYLLLCFFSWGSISVTSPSQSLMPSADLVS